MITPRSTELQRIDNALLLECVAPRSRQHLADLLVSPDVHFLVLYTCADESRFEYLEVGPGRRAHRVEDALGVHPDSLQARYLVVSSTCPEGVIPVGLTSAHSVPYGLARLVPMRPVAIKPSLRLPDASAAATKPNPVNTTETASLKKIVAATEVSAPTSLQTHGAVTFSALPDETPADTLRRALHGVLSSITDREAALSVREGSVGERLGVFANREQELSARAAELTSRENAFASEIAARESALAEREAALSAAEEDFKVRRNSVAFREKNITAREQDAESRLLDINAREGAIRNAEREFSDREVSLAAREKDARSLLAAVAAEKAAFDEIVAAHKVREAAVAAREKHIASQESTFKAETAALLAALESITSASRASVIASSNGR